MLLCDTFLTADANQDAIENAQREVDGSSTSMSPGSLKPASAQRGLAAAKDPKTKLRIPINWTNVS